MKFIPVFCRGLQFSILLVTLSYCTQQKNIKGGDPTSIPEDTSAVLNEYEVVESNQTDSMQSVKEYLCVSTNKLNEIDKRLAQINIAFNAEKRNLSLALGGEIFQLNKKHLSLKAKIRESVNYSSSSLIEFEATIAEELAMLEAAIFDFDKKINKNNF